MLNYTRLWRLEAGQGTEAQAERYLALAVEECVLSEWDDCTPETPVKFLDLLEEIRRDKARTRMRREKEADDTFWIGPGKLMHPPREGL